MLVNMSAILQNAQKDGYGVVAPSVFDGESIRVCFEAARELRAPLILNAGGVDLEYIADVTRFYSERFIEVPVALNLDHGNNLKQVTQAIRAGFSSVMIDSSEEPFEKNIEITKQIVEVAHYVGISVEAELGHVGRGSNYEDERSTYLTRVEEAEEFVERTGVDCLAIAVGTAHGLYKGQPQIDFERLKCIRASILVPLVLHGGSSTGDENLSRAISCGVSKINLGTDLVMKGAAAARKVLKRNDAKLAAVIFSGAEGYKSELIRYMRLFRENGRW